MRTEVKKVVDNKRFTVYDNEANTVLELLNKLGEYTNDVVDELNNKTDLTGDHKGSWQGIKRPTMSDEGLRGTVEKIVDGDLPRINEQLETKAKLDDERFLCVENFGAKGNYNELDNSGSDDTNAIQSAIDYAYHNKISTVSFGSKGYLIKGQIIVRKGVTLIGTRNSFTQTISTNTDNGENRYRIITETTLKIKPSDISITPLIFEEQSGIKNLSIIYDQNFASNVENDITKYAVTIKAKHGFSAYNLCFKGAYSLIEAEGESIKIDKIYGWSFGTGLKIINSNDVSFINNIHLNPNVTRPTTSCSSLSKYRNDSIALEIINCDGVTINNFFCINYRTGIKSKGNGSIGDNQFTLNNFFMDWVGVAFDLDMDCGWSTHISNGTVIYGFTNDENHGGLVKLNKSDTNNIFQTINFVNVSCNMLGNYIVSGLKPKYLINFIFKYGFNINFTNVSFDNKLKVISEHGSIVKGIIRCADYYVDLDSQTRNLLTNSNLTEITDGVPNQFSKVLPDYTSVNCKLNDEGYCLVENSDNLSAWHGIQYRHTLSERGDMCYRVKFLNWTNNTSVFIKWYDDNYSNTRTKTLNVDENGIVQFRTDAGKIFDLIICPSMGVSGSCVIDNIKVSKWGY